MENQVIVFTPFHSITGNLMLRDQRLSDLLNDRRNTVIHLFDATFTPLSQPGENYKDHTSALVRKEDIVVAYEPSDQTQPTRRLYSFVRKQQHEICLLMDSIQVRGMFHTPGALDVIGVHRLITTGHEMFLPITRVIIKFGPACVITQDAAIVNSRRISYIAIVKSGKEEASTGAG